MTFISQGAQCQVNIPRISGGAERSGIASVKSIQDADMWILQGVNGGSWPTAAFDGGSPQAGLGSPGEFTDRLGSLKSTPSIRASALLPTV